MSGFAVFYVALGFTSGVMFTIQVLRHVRRDR